MADKQALNATFFAFRKREKSGVLTMTTIAFIIISLISFGLFAAINFPALVDYANWYGSLISQSARSDGAVSPEMVMPPASVMALGPMMFLFQVLFYVIAAAYEAACLRWMIRGETGGLFGFSFGADTWRVYFTYWIWFFIGIAFAIVFAIVAGGFIGSMFAVGAAGGETSNGMAGLAMIIPLVCLALLLLMLWISVRLAPAAATSIARRRFAFFDAWKVTKGRFWGLLGAFVLLYVMFMVAYIVVYLVAVGAAIFGFMSQVGSTGQEMTPDQAFAMLAQPQILIPMALVGIAATVGYFIWLVALFGVNARAAQLALEEGKITAEA